MHLDSLAKNISSNKRHSFCSIYLSVISDLRKTHSQHISKRKTLLIDICDRCIHPIISLYIVSAVYSTFIIYIVQYKLVALNEHMLCDGMAKLC